jgi:hypothetical protein
VLNACRVTSMDDAHIFTRISCALFTCDMYMCRLRHTNDPVLLSLKMEGIFETRPDRFWDPPSLLYNGYRVPFPGVKRLQRGVDHPPSLASRLNKEYSYTSAPYLILCNLL